MAQTVDALGRLMKECLQDTRTDYNRQAYPGGHPLAPRPLTRRQKLRNLPHRARYKARRAREAVALRIAPWLDA